MVSNPFIPILKGKTILMGIGNTLRGDDGAGPILVERLERSARARSVPVLLMNAGNAPERFLGKALRENPDTLLLVDAVHLSDPPGGFRIMTLSEVADNGSSTHDVSLRTLLAELHAVKLGEERSGRRPNLWKQEHEGNLLNAVMPCVYVLGVQPARMDLGLGLSPQVDRTLRLCERLLLQALHPFGGANPPGCTGTPAAKPPSFR